MRKPEHPQPPRSLPVKAGKGKGVYPVHNIISPLDCMGCGVASGACPERVRAIKMWFRETRLDQQDVFDYCLNKVSRRRSFRLPTSRAASSQAAARFSGSARLRQDRLRTLVTQLFGDKMYISNATSCSSI